MNSKILEIISNFQNSEISKERKEVLQPLIDYIQSKRNTSEKIRLNSSAGTGHFYTTDKNKRTMPEKMEIKKFDPVVRKHVVYKEGKIK